MILMFDHIVTPFHKVSLPSNVSYATVGKLDLLARFKRTTERLHCGTGFCADLAHSECNEFITIYP